jgi:hypothetical protein
MTQMQCPKGKQGECDKVCPHKVEHALYDWCSVLCKQFIPNVQCQPVPEAQAEVDALVLRHASIEQLLEELKSRTGVQVLTMIEIDNKLGLSTLHLELEPNEYLVRIEKP